MGLALERHPQPAWYDLLRRVVPASEWPRLRRLAALDLPVTVFSRHAAHLELAARLGEELCTAVAEPSPWEGPLLALQRLMEQFPEQRLLLCPVDMPALTTDVLHQLLTAAAGEPTVIHLAHDGRRLQPLLGIYPSDAGHRTHLAAAVASGERRLQSWLTGATCRQVELDRRALRNVNRPEPPHHQQPAPAPAPA